MSRARRPDNSRSRRRSWAEDDEEKGAFLYFTMFGVPVCGVLLGGVGAHLTHGFVRLPFVLVGVISWLVIFFDIIMLTVGKRLFVAINKRIDETVGKRESGSSEDSH